MRFCFASIYLKEVKSISFMKPEKMRITARKSFDYKKKNSVIPFSHRKIKSLCRVLLDGAVKSLVPHKLM